MLVPKTIPGHNSAMAIGDSKLLQNRANSAQYACWSDGSMDQWGKGGAAYILESHQQLVKYELKSFKWGISPFHIGRKHGLKESFFERLRWSEPYWSDNPLLKTVAKRQEVRRRRGDVGLVEQELMLGF